MVLPASDDQDFTEVKVAHKSIRLKKQHPEQAQRIVAEHKIHPVAARVLAARGFDAGEKLRLFIDPTLKEGLPPPDQLKGLEEACLLIGEVTRAGGAVAICCDFDVDGLSGGSQLYHFLSIAGVRAKVFVPDRFEDGYGLNEGMIRQIAEEKFALVVTIDYGTTNEKELTLARKLGLRTVVVDHHHVGTHKQVADVFINPNQSGCGFADKTLCAAGLTWYLLLGLKKTVPGAESIDVRRYLDLACLGTICDMVPLNGANRVLAKKGLEMLTQTQRPGLIALKNVIAAKSPVSCWDVSFGIGPRINAAGRMVHGGVVVELLTTQDSIAAEKIARQLNALNVQRQETEAMVKQMAIADIKERGRIPAALVVWDPTFHTGVIGIVAQRLVESFYRPAVVLGADKDGVFKGSVRGVKGLSVVQTLAAVGEHLIKFGGHDGAGGLSVKEEKLEEFAEAFIAECEKRLEGVSKTPVAEADTEADVKEISVELVKQLQAFAPFGVGNPSPQILVPKLKVHELRVLKNTHLKVTFTDGKSYLTGLMWRQTSHPALVVGKLVNVICKPDVNAYQGNVSVQAHIEAVEPVAV